MPNSSDRLVSTSNRVTEEANLPAYDYTEGKACIIPSREMRQIIYDHDRGVVSKLADRLFGYIQDLRGR